MDEPADAPPTGPGHLTLIGTGHVLDIADRVKDAILAIRPDVVFVELDRGRLQALMARRAGQEPELQGGWLQKRLHNFQEHVAAEYGVRAGDEMLAAVDAGFLTGAKVALVDRPVQQTLRRATKEVTWRERFRLLGMVVGGTVKGFFTRESAKETVDRELDDYAADPGKTLGDLQRRFPTIHRVVIAERDTWMARRIHAGLDGGRTGVAVVGDGHVDGLLRELDDVPTTAYRLPDVREGRLPRPDPDDTSSVTVGFDV